MKNKWSKYALKDGKIQSSYLREYSSRSPKRERREASGRNSLLQSGEKQAEEEVKLVYRPPVHPIPQLKILEDAWVINLKGEKDGSDDINRERRSSEETGRDEDTQSSSSGGSVMDVQDVPGKRVRRKRKATDSKRDNDGSQEQKEIKSE